MHEASLIQQIIETSVSRCRQAGASKITVIRLEVGALSGVDHQALSFAFEAISSRTLAEGAVLDLIPVPAACRCGACGACYTPENFWDPCPECRQSEGRVVKGYEMNLLQLEVE